MMKIAITLLLCLCTGLAHAQVFHAPKLLRNPQTHLLAYTEIVPVPGASADALAERAQRWSYTQFKDPDLLLLADGLVGQGWRDITTAPDGHRVTAKLRYAVRLVAADGRYQYEITSFRIEDYATATFPDPQPVPVESFMTVKVGAMFRDQIAQERQQLLAAAQQIAAAIKTGMGGPAAATREE